MIKVSLTLKSIVMYLLFGARKKPTHSNHHKARFSHSNDKMKSMLHNLRPEMGFG